MLQYKLKSELGTFYLVASQKGLKWVSTSKMDVPFVKSPQESPVLQKAVTQLEEYFAGARSEFDLPFDLEGTAFQKQVWKALTTIPYGKTKSYQDIARKINNGKACRAVGSANGKNPLCIVIPCHRVIASDGSLGGYSAGLKLKEKLMQLEGAS